MPKRVPKRTRRGSFGHLQTLQIASNMPSRDVSERGNFEKLIFKGCTIRNDRFWQCQGPPRRHQKRAQRLSERFCGCLGDDQKWTPKLDQGKNPFLRCQPAGRSQVSGPGPWKLHPKYLSLYIYIYTRIFARATRALDSLTYQDLGHSSLDITLIKC